MGTESLSEANMRDAISWSCVAWWPHSRRSEAFAKALGASLHCVHHIRTRSRFSVPIRYTLQAFHTLWILFKERPQAVHVQNPPIACSLVVYFFCRLCHAEFVLDHHSAAFAGVWDWALPIQRFVAQQAATNIVTNQYWADRIHAWDAPALIIGEPFLDLPEGEVLPKQPGFSVAFVSTFAPDEPLDQVLQAAPKLPAVHFYVTGDSKQSDHDRYEPLPPNVVLTGFLPDAQYIGFLRAVDGIMALTTRNHTLQLGGCEAVSVGQPLIVSDWPCLRDTFPKGTVYAANTSEGIRDAVLLLQQEHEALRQEMLLFRDEARKEWYARCSLLNELVACSLDRSS